MDSKKLQFLIRTGFSAAVLITSLAAHGDIFQWRDENGKLHFGDRPPEQLESQKVTPRTSPVIQELEVSQLENRLLGGEVKDEIEELKDIMEVELKKQSEIRDKAAEDRIEETKRQARAQLEYADGAPESGEGLSRQ